MNIVPVSLLRGLSALAEGPWWHTGEQKLYFTDIPAGRIWQFDPVSSRAELFHKGEIVGGMSLQQDGGWVLFREKDLAWLDAGGRLIKVRQIYLPGAQRFNDVVADTAGRGYAGTIGVDAQSGGLYRFDPSGSCTCLFQGTRISNGSVFDPRESCFYWTCTTRGAIYRFDYASESGTLSNQSILYQCEPAEGLPDGLTVDLEGNLWSARWGTGLIVILSPQGKKLDQIHFPESNITSLTWGGAQLRDLYVTAAREEGTPGIHDLFVVPEVGRGTAQSCSSLCPNTADEAMVS